MKSLRSDHRLWLVTILWIAAVVIGFALLLDYTSATGPVAATPRGWPDASRLPRRPLREVLIFVHPHCPCTAATLSQVDRAIARRSAPSRVRVVGVLPAGADGSFAEGPVIRRARGLAHVEVVFDPTGATADAFGVHTSGHVCVYSETGDLEFSGGVTAGRGHEGDNAGFAALVSLLEGRQLEHDRTATFGCLLLDRLQPDDPGTECPECK